MTSNRKTFKDKILISAGRVRRAFGVRGQLSVDWNNGESPVPIVNGTIYMNEAGDGLPKRFTILKDHRHGDCNVITLGGVESKEEANRFRGSGIWVDETALPALNENEYYSYQLIDMKVETTEGEYLGKIEQIFPTGSNDVYVVRDGDKEILLPAIEDVVKEIDAQKNVMIVELIEGLV